MSLSLTLESISRIIGHFHDCAASPLLWPEFRISPRRAINPAAPQGIASPKTHTKEATCWQQTGIIPPILLAIAIIGIRLPLRPI